MAFLSDLGNIINEQFSFGENSVSSLDSNGDRVTNFGMLGDFAKKFDQGAERTYIEDGLINNIRPRQREILFQEPDITLIIKKKMFSSLIENSRLDLMEEKERLFIRASKKLFQNKCRLMSIYERLSKIERVSRETGQFNTALIPSTLAGITELENAGFQFLDPQTRSILDDLRRAVSFSQSTNFTTWVVDQDQVFSGALGEGTGVIELTTVSDINTRVTTDLGGGSCSFNIEDPYKILRVTQKDIDQALNDSQNFFKNSPLGRLADGEIRERINNLKNRLNLIREARGVSGIRFVISPQTIISKKVRAILERQGREINFDYNPGLVGLGSSVNLDSKETEGFEGLNETEEQLFKDIISDTFLLIGLQNTTRSEIKEFNKEVNYARNRMRLMFKGKSIINHMDVVNVFMTTRTAEDTKLTEGFPGYNNSGGFALGQKINNLVRNINNTLSDFSGSKTSPDEIEKSAIVGPNFPTWLWRMFRNSFTAQGAGTAVFVGLVKNVEQKYASGKYTVSVECEDNSGYLNKSQINIKPSLQVFNSTLYDPLTPFDVSFDAATGVPTNDVIDGQIPPLLPENQRLLETRALKFKSTEFRGQNSNQILYKTKKDEIVFGKLRRVLADSDGFVYRWKQGIGSITKVERADPESRISDERPPRLTAQPFAGQDVMNVLSLLIAGVPYNYNTFLKNSLANGNDVQAYDPANNEDTYASYIDGVVRELSKRNVLWGNFIPFKGLSVNEEAFAFIRKGQSDLTRRQSKINSLLRQRAALFDERALRLAGEEIDPSETRPLSDIESGLDKQIAQLDLQIQRETQAFSEAESKLFTSKENGSINLVGNDISFEPGFNEFDGTSSISQSDQSLRRSEFRRRINSFTRRILWKVKSNSDNNLLVIDDQYDKNYDIQAFERRIDGALQLFDSEYITVDGQVKSTAEILGLEVFADSQGNIVIRPPLYNRVPSSVFYKMFKDRDETGIKVFPDFLETLLFNQVSAMQNRLEIIEDEIRLRGITIGVFGNTMPDTDREIANFIRGNRNSNQSTSTGGPFFTFVTDPSTGKIGGELIAKIQQQSDPSNREQEQDRSIELIQGQSSVTRAFDLVTRVQEVSKENYIADAVTVTGDSRLQIIRQRLLSNKGVKAPTSEELISSKRVQQTGKASALDVLNITNEIAELVSERQKLLKSLSGTIKNLQEGLQINENDDGAKSTLAPFLNRKTIIPSMLEHMIEDESIDDLGVGSGKRFVIKEHQIISRTYTETPPPFTAVQVNGLFAEGFVDPITSLNTNLSGASGGNAVVSAYAVDYDMWYQYGFRAANSVQAPWASDPEAQCAPYAVTLLNIARGNIFGGSITISGYNEFYQAGDVIYIEDDDLLFYVKSVSHSFSFKGPLTTTLSLSFGHSPGEYIPTPLDMVGKYLYSAQTYSEQFRSSRFDIDGDDISVGAIMVQDNFEPENLFKGPYGKHNRKVVGKLLYSATGAVNTVENRNVRPILQLRVYGENGQSALNVNLAASTIKDYLVSPTKFSTLGDKQIPDEEYKDNFKLNNDQISEPNSSEDAIVDIDEDTRSPSAAAWNLVRLIQREGTGNSSNLNNESDTPILNDNTLDTILMKNVIDAFVVFQPVEESVKDSSQENQAAQEANEEVQSANSAARDARSDDSE